MTDRNSPLSESKPELVIKPVFKAVWLAALVLACSTLLVSPLIGAGTPKPKPSVQSEGDELYKLGEAAADKGDYKLALDYFKKARKMDPKNPDVLNMLAYSLRKTGEIDEAIELYHKALKLRPDFPEAREYLGEAYLQAALREVETLRGYGEEGSEALEELIEAFKKAAEEL